MTPSQPVFGSPGGRDLYLGRRYARWAMWGCFTVVLLGILMVGGLFLRMLKDPNVLRSAENLARCQERMQELSGALGRYYEDKGSVPARLEDLYPTYLADKVNLRCPSDPVAGTQTSYVLRRGIPWGDGKAVLVYCPHHPAQGLMPGKSGKEAGNVVPVILQDGDVEREIAPLARFQDVANPVAPKR